MKKIKFIVTITLLTTWTLRSVQGLVLEPIPAAPSTQQHIWYISPSVAGFANREGVFPWPVIGVGSRWQSNHTGFDTSLSFSGHPLGAVYSKVDALWLYIPRPNLASQWYFGAGVGIGFFWIKLFGSGITIVGATPDLAIGYQHQTSSGRQQFFQFCVGIPIVGDGRWRDASLMNLSYGFGF